jgi:hypothetical protein
LVSTGNLCILPAEKSLVMSLPVNNKNNGKPGKNNKGSMMGGNSKFIAKPGTKAAGPAKKPVKTGGSRGS